MDIQLKCAVRFVGTSAKRVVQFITEVELQKSDIT